LVAGEPRVGQKTLHYLQVAVDAGVEQGRPCPISNIDIEGLDVQEEVDYLYVAPL
jgi:hypothetical protein